MSEWTPGPWKALQASDAEYGFGWWLHSPNYGAVGFWRGGKENDTNRYWQLTEPDAHLIAAAPDLYEAILTAIAEIETISPAVPSATARLDAVVDEMRRILSRARGEAQ